MEEALTGVISFSGLVGLQRTIPPALSIRLAYASLVLRLSFWEVNGWTAGGSMVDKD